jgi:hypothetical protein
MAKKLPDAIQAAAIQAGAQLAIFATSKQTGLIQPIDLARRTAEMADLILQYYGKQPSAKKK